MIYYARNQDDLAWYRLTEYIARDCKAEAIGLYRLLSRSIEDDAIVQHLLGDILYTLKEYDAARQAYASAQQGE